LKAFMAKANAQLEAELNKRKTTPLKRQSFNPIQLAHGIYKIYVNDRYACTGTLVGNKMYVVLHCLEENSEVKMKAINSSSVIELKPELLVVVSPEIGYIPVNSVASVFKKKNFKMMENAGIVSVFGFGNGQKEEPDLLIGFASPLGWYNCATRDGDCTSPVLNGDGNIVGFHTHGDGKGFGKFEPITQEFLDAIDDDNVTLNGLDFRTSLSSPVNC
jgi:hypothetical protein